MNYTAILTPCDRGWFAAQCPEVPAANGQGKNEHAAAKNLMESILLVLDVIDDLSQV